MKTKGDILKKELLSIKGSDARNIQKNVRDRWEQFNVENSTIAIYNSMDEYAKQQSIAFAKWISDNEKEGNSDELYAQFIEQQLPK